MQLHDCVNFAAERDELWNCPCHYNWNAHQNIALLSARIRFMGACMRQTFFYVLNQSHGRISQTLFRPLIWIACMASTFLRADTMLSTIFLALKNGNILQIHWAGLIKMHKRCKYCTSFETIWKTPLEITCIVARICIAGIGDNSAGRLTLEMDAMHLIWIE